MYGTKNSKVQLLEYIAAAVKCSYNLRVKLRLRLRVLTKVGFVEYAGVRRQFVMLDLRPRVPYLSSMFLVLGLFPAANIAYRKTKHVYYFVGVGSV